MKNKILFLLVVLLATSSLFTQETTLVENNTNTQKIKISAKREINDPLNTSLATTIITSDELKAKGAKTLTDALKDNAGLQVEEQGNSATLKIRGSTAEQVLILINGVRLNKAQGMGVDLSQYGVENVDRIEIIRGTAATRYGANAVGGVINIITKDRVDNVSGIETSIRYGSFDTKSITALVSKSFGKEEQGSIFIGGALNMSDGDFPYKYEQSGTEYSGKMENDKTSSASVRGGLSYKFKNTDALYFDISALADYKQIPNPYGGFGFTGDFGKQYQNVENYAANLAYENNSLSIFNFSLKAGVLNQVKEYKDPKLLYPQYSKFNNTETTVRADLYRTDKFGGNIFTFRNNLLLEYVNEVLKAHTPRTEFFKGNGKTAIRNTFSAAYLPELGFLNFENSDISRLVLSPAIRVDVVSDSKVKNEVNFALPTYSLGAMYAFDKERRYNIKANFATGYRLPSFDDLYWPAAGNPDLKTEKSIGGDVGVILKPHDVIRLEALYYVSSIKDMIAWAPSPTTEDPYRWIPSNINKVLLQGIEANMLLSVPIKQALSRAELNLNYLYQFGHVVGGADNGHKLARTPVNSANLVLSYIFEGNDTVSAKLNFYTHYIGERFNTVANLDSGKLKEVTTFDLTAAVTVLDTVTFEGGVKNIANTYYENVIGYLQPGREWYTLVRAKF